MDISTGGGYFFAHYMIDAVSAVKQYDSSGKLLRDIKLPGIGTASGFGGNVASVSIDDTFKALKLNFINNIVWGNVPNEFFVKFSKSQLVDLVIKKNILKISDLTGYSDNILLSDMNKFKFKNVSSNNFTPDILSAIPLLLSPAQDRAEIVPGLTDVEDYGGHLRDSTPDIGAIEILK